MRATAALIPLVCAAALLSGCTGLSSLTSSPVGPSIIGNLQGCVRHYEGALGVGVTGSFRIDCPAHAAPAPDIVSPGGVP